MFIGCVALGTRVCVLGAWLSGHGCVYWVRGSGGTGGVYRVRGSGDTVFIGCVALGARGVYWVLGRDMREQRLQALYKYIHTSTYII